MKSYRKNLVSLQAVGKHHSFQEGTVIISFNHNKRIMKGQEQESLNTLHLSKQLFNIDRFRPFCKGRIEQILQVNPTKLIKKLKLLKYLLGNFNYKITFVSNFLYKTTNVPHMFTLALKPRECLSFLRLLFKKKMAQCSVTFLTFHTLLKHLEKN